MLIVLKIVCGTVAGLCVAWLWSRALVIHVPPLRTRVMMVGLLLASGALALAL